MNVLELISELINKGFSVTFEEGLPANTSTVIRVVKIDNVQRLQTEVNISKEQFDTPFYVQEVLKKIIEDMSVHYH